MSPYSALIIIWKRFSSRNIASAIPIGSGSGILAMVVCGPTGMNVSGVSGNLQSTRPVSLTSIVCRRKAVFLMIAGALPTFSHKNWNRKPALIASAGSLPYVPRMTISLTAMKPRRLRRKEATLVSMDSLAMATDSFMSLDCLAAYIQRQVVAIARTAVQIVSQYV